VQTISDEFVPYRAHIREQPGAFHRFNAYWTPTQIITDENGVERHRIEGFLPRDDFLAELEIGRGRVAFAGKEFEKAQKHFRNVLDRYPKTESAAEACYWEGVSEYSRTHEGAVLARTGKRLKEKFPGTIWARKGSVWLR
jgi:hypothetical protein